MRSLNINLAASCGRPAPTLTGAGFGLHDLAAARLRSAATLTASEQKALILPLVWSAATALALLLINIAWQRYYLPMVPVACLWAAYRLAAVVKAFAPAARRPNRSRES